MQATATTTAKATKQANTVKKPAAAKKTPAKKIVKQDVAPVAPVAPVETPAAVATIETRDYAKEFHAVLIARNAIAKSNDTETAAGNVLRDSAAFNKCFDRVEFKEVFSTMLKHCAIAEAKENRADFVAVKTLVKIVSTARAIGLNMSSELDGYTRTIGQNLASLGQLTIKSGLVSLSKSVEYDELEQQQHLQRRMNCSPGTAGAQSGSTRMCLRELGIAQVVKGKRGDVMTLETDNARANAFVALFK